MYISDVIERDLTCKTANGFEIMQKASCSLEEVPYCSYVICLLSSLYRLKNLRVQSNLSKIVSAVAAIKSLRFAL